MTKSITPKQALFLWNLILTDGGKDSGVKWSATKPKLDPAEKQSLVDAGYLNLSRSGRSKILTSAERAWTWAEQLERVELLKSNSPLGAEALEALLKRLLPLLRERQIGLADLFSNEAQQKKPRLAKSAAKMPPALPKRIEQACLQLTNGARQTRIKLHELRQSLRDVPRQTLDAALLELQRQKKLVLYREDNSAALRREDHQAALLVGDEPRHLVLLEAR